MNKEIATPADLLQLRDALHAHYGLEKTCFEILTTEEANNIGLGELDGSN